MRELGDVPKEPDFIADTPISAPLSYEEWELVDMNGFSFTQRNGIVLSSRIKRADFVRIAEEKRE